MSPCNSDNRDCGLPCIHGGGHSDLHRCSHGHGWGGDRYDSVHPVRRRVFEAAAKDMAIPDKHYQGDFSSFSDTYFGRRQ